MSVDGDPAPLIHIIRSMRANPPTKDSDIMNSFAQPAIYEIRIHGLLGETLLAGFPDFEARAVDGDTVLTGVLVDQAALHGVLGQVEALGLELLEVRRGPSPCGVIPQPRNEANEL